MGTSKTSIHKFKLIKSLYSLRFSSKLLLSIPWYYIWILCWLHYRNIFLFAWVVDAQPTSTMLRDERAAIVSWLLKNELLNHRIHFLCLFSFGTFHSNILLGAHTSILSSLSMERTRIIYSTKKEIACMWSV